MKIVCISDTHNRHKDFDVPDGDVIIHSGDATNRGTLAEIKAFAEWFGELPHKYKIFVPGNHDLLFETNEALARSCFSAKVNVLIDQNLWIEGVQFFGTPWTPKYGKWAFHYEREEGEEWWKRIPEGIDVLIVHGPPFAIMDMTSPKWFSKNTGCVDLLRRIAQVMPKLTVFGHIHNSHGVVRLRPQFSTHDMLFVNAAISDDEYIITFQPEVIDL